MVVFWWNETVFKITRDQLIQWVQFRTKKKSRETGTNHSKCKSFVCSSDFHGFSILQLNCTVLCCVVSVNIRCNIFVTHWNLNCDGRIIPHTQTMKNMPKNWKWSERLSLFNGTLNAHSLYYILSNQIFNIIFSYGLRIRPKIIVCAEKGTPEMKSAESLNFFCVWIF